MSVVAMEFQCIKTIMIYLVDKSDFIPFDHNLCSKSENCGFSSTKLALRKF